MYPYCQLQIVLPQKVNEFDLFGSEGTDESSTTSINNFPTVSAGIILQSVLVHDHG
jgi:hypothetical protein